MHLHKGCTIQDVDESDFGYIDLADIKVRKK